MLIARLVRRPPAMTARSSPGVASRGVHEYLPLTVFFRRFSPSCRFLFLLFLFPRILLRVRLFITRDPLVLTESGLGTFSLSASQIGGKLTLTRSAPNC